MLYAMCAAAFFALTLLMIKLSTIEIYPPLANFLFSAVATCFQFIFLIFLVRTKQIGALPNFRTILIPLVGGGFLALYSLFTFLALSQIPIWKASPVIYSGGVLVAVLLGIAFLKESPGWVQMIGIALGIASIVLLFYQS